MLRLTAPTWKLRAIWGSAVAMMVPSRFSMNRAPAIRVVTKSGERLCFMDLFYGEVCGDGGASPNGGRRSAWMIHTPPCKKLLSTAAGVEDDAGAHTQVVLD